MIRQSKCPNTPSSLLTSNSYDGEDVKAQLIEDGFDKCYLCERRRDTDFEIEHLMSVNNHPELRLEWQNLLMGCGYCNRKKRDQFDDILNPLAVNIEDEIEQRLDSRGENAVFTSPINDAAHSNTIKLLTRIFNGTGKMRTIKENCFFNYALSIINDFIGFVSDYCIVPSAENKKRVEDALAITEEMLGFKYWIIKDNSELYAQFHEYIIWNKRP